jgi:hypothetical protein
MLTDSQLEDLSVKMNIPLEDIIFKDRVPNKFLFNKSYIINLEDEYNEDGTLNNGSHWTCLQVNKYPNGNVEGIYFDPFGIAPPQDVLDCYKRTTGKNHFPHNTKDIQSLMSNACGWYCCAFLHFINNFSHRTKNLYSDTEHFLEFFDDLNKSVDFKKNEFMLKHFFQSKDPSKRKEIEVIADPNSIETDVNGGRVDMMSIPVDVVKR